MAFYSRHIFPHLLARASRHFDQERRDLLSRARGRVLELGVGGGASLGFYPPQVSDVVGIDISPVLLERAASEAERFGNGRAAGLPYRLHLHLGDAQALPYDDASFDTVVAFLTLCTVPDPRLTAQESFRVLRPGGILLVLEHVRAAPGRKLARWQDRLDPLWTRLAGGCHLNRDTPANLAAAGFDTSSLERYHDQTYFPPASPRLRGATRKE